MMGEKKLVYANEGVEERLRKKVRKLEEARKSDAQIVSDHMNGRRLLIRQIRTLEANNAKVLIAIDLIITHLTGYDLDDEMDAGDFAELNPEAWSIFQEVVAENKNLTTSPQ